LLSDKKDSKENDFKGIFQNPSSGVFKGSRTNLFLKLQFLTQAIAKQIDVELMNPAVGGFSTDQVCDYYTAIKRICHHLNMSIQYSLWNWLD
jgi:hypothetical protein